jgi:CHASE3 domain sensor protein
MLTGYIIARYKTIHEMEHLYKYNDELQEEVSNLNEVLAKVVQQENSDVD